jgi:hypothetical protein
MAWEAGPVKVAGFWKETDMVDLGSKARRDGAALVVCLLIVVRRIHEVLEDKNALRFRMRGQGLRTCPRKQTPAGEGGRRVAPCNTG